MFFDGFVHHLADVIDASPAFGIFGFTQARPSPFFRGNAFHDAGFPMGKNILFYVMTCVLKTVTNEIIHFKTSRACPDRGLKCNQ